MPTNQKEVFLLHWGIYFRLYWAGEKGGVPEILALCASGQAVPEPMESPWGFLFIPPGIKRAKSRALSRCFCCA